MKEAVVRAVGGFAIEDTVKVKKVAFEISEDVRYVKVFEVKEQDTDEEPLRHEAEPWGKPV